MRVVEKLKRYLLHRSGSVMMRKFSRLRVIMANHKGSTNRNSNVDNRRITRHLSSNQNCTVQEEGKLWSSHMALCAWLKTKKPGNFFNGSGVSSPQQQLFLRSAYAEFGTCGGTSDHAKLVQQGERRRLRQGDRSERKCARYVLVLDLAAREFL